jgi:hypothetical protein
MIGAQEEHRQGDCLTDRPDGTKLGIGRINSIEAVGAGTKGSHLVQDQEKP